MFIFVHAVTTCLYSQHCLLQVMFHSLLFEVLLGFLVHVASWWSSLDLSMILIVLAILSGIWNCKNDVWFFSPMSGLYLFRWILGWICRGLALLKHPSSDTRIRPPNPELDVPYPEVGPQIQGCGGVERCCYGVVLQPLVSNLVLFWHPLVIYLCVSYLSVFLLMFAGCLVSRSSLLFLFVYCSTSNVFLISRQDPNRCNKDNLQNIQILEVNNNE